MRRFIFYIFWGAITAALGQESTNYFAGLLAPGDSLPYPTNANAAGYFTLSGSNLTFSIDIVNFDPTSNDVAELTGPSGPTVL